ncbi:MAG: long-chain fatty acid--CoA ligase [Syntrophobacteraceae bacterium]|nr:long-chain fatty acid--CoA ligase [Desulfobacteraceae bacterium]
MILSARMEGVEMGAVWHKSYDPGVPRSLEYPAMSLPILIEESSRKVPGNKAIEFYGVALSYEELWTRIRSLANAFHRMGMKPGDRVAIMLPNCPQAVIAYYAVLWLGGVVVMTNPMYVEREMEYQWKDSGAEYLVILDHLFPRAERVLKETAIGKVIVTSLTEYFPFLLKMLYPIRAWKKKLFTAVPYGENILSFASLVSGTPPDPPPCSVKPDDLAMLQYTGGTTGVPKGVMLLHRNLVANIVQLVSWVPEIRFGEERFLSVLPFFHIFGLTVAMNLPLYIGASNTLVPRFEIKEFLRLLQKGKPSLLPGVPTIYLAMLNSPDVEKYDLTSIEFCITGSAPMPVESLRRFERITGGRIIEGYGLSESSPVTHVNPAKGVRKAGSIGIPLSDTEYRIVDIDRGIHEQLVGEIGELLVRGPQVMSGYWRKPEETEIALRDGWLYTGDIARRDEEGYVYIVDRKKDMIIAGGYNIYPREIDEVLCEHPKIIDAAVVGVPDQYRGETVKAFIVLKPGESMTAEEVIRYCKAKVAAYKVPKQIEFRENLPKTTVGKIARKELRREAVELYEASIGRKEKKKES